MIKVLKKEWINISLIDDWKTQYKLGQVCVYLVEQKNHKVIDMTFDKLQAQDHLKWTTSFISFIYFCFMIWKNLLNETQKDRVVVDIWALNKIIMLNIYLVLSQTNILIAVQEIKYIFTVDCSFFFYQ